MTGVILFIHAILAHMAGDRDKDVTEQVHIETWNDDATKLRNAAYISICL